MPKIFLTMLLLMRVNNPIGYWLVFFPSVFGLFLAFEKLDNLLYAPIFFIGAIVTRSAGCIINDIFDKDFDRQVNRTKARPLASNKISIGAALALLFLLLVISFVILLSLSVTSIIIGIIAFLMIILYPMMKRFTHFPQVFLGLTFNLGCLIAYSAIKDDVSQEALMMYLACGFWTFGYDTIYAFMDIKDDKKIGIRSSAIFLEHRYYKFWIAFAYICFVALFIIANLAKKNYLGVVGGSIALPLLLWQVLTLDIANSASCLVRFKANMYIGLIMSFMMLLGIVI